MAATSLVVDQSARATTYSWASTSNTDFNTATNWSPNGVPGTATTDIASFVDPTGLVTTVNIAASPNPFAQISFSTTTSSGYDLTGTNSAAFTLNSTGTGTSGAIVAANTTGNNTIDAPVNFSAATATIYLSGTNTSRVLTMNGVLAGTNLSLGGAGTINFNGANTYTGGTTIGAATLTTLVVKTISASGGGASNLGAATSATAGFISLGNNSATGTLQYTGTGSTTDRQIALSNTSSTTLGGSVIDSSGTGALVFTGVSGTNDVTTKSTVTAPSGHALTLQGSFGTISTANVFGEKLTDLTVGTGSATPTGVFKAGAGTWSLTGANTYTGGTTVTVGTLIAGSTTAFGSTSSLLAVSNGAIIDLAVDSSVAAYNVATSSTTTINSDRATAGAGITHTLGALSAQAGTFNVASGPNVTSGTAGLAFGAVTLNGTASGGATASSTVAFTPTTATLTLGSVTGSAASGNTNTLGLAGTSAGNSVTGVISNSSAGTTAVSKSGTSTWTLSGQNTYTGVTTLNGGTLIVSNTGGNTSTSSGTGTGAFNFGATASTLASGAGSVGSIGGAVTTTSKTVSTIAPGGVGTVGMLTLNSLNAATGATFAFDLGSTSGGASSDQLAITNALAAPTATGSGNLAFSFTNQGATAGTTYTLVTFASATNLDMGDLTASGVTGTFGVSGTAITFTVTAVPEPSTWIAGLMAGALCIFTIYRRKTALCGR